MSKSTLTAQYPDASTTTVSDRPAPSLEPIRTPLRIVADADRHRSTYLVKRLFDTPEHNLFNHVKFNLVNDQLKKHCHGIPRLFDIGCGLQVARRYLRCLNRDIQYFGVDYESAFSPDAVVDLNEAGALNAPMQWQPDVVMLLDVLEHLHEDVDSLDKVVAHVADAMPEQAVVIVTVPQLYRLDCLKLQHLHYPEHKIRLTHTEWSDLLRRHFDIDTVQGLGYLSVLPYLPMAFKRYTPENRLGKLFAHLRGKTFEAAWLKPLDLFLSRTLGRFGPFKRLSNDILFVLKKPAS